MTWTANIPQAGDAFSVSQTQLLGNVNFLSNTAGNAIPGHIEFPNGLKMNWGNQGPGAPPGGPWTALGSSRYLSPPQIFDKPFTSSVYTILVTARRGGTGSAIHFYYVYSGIAPTNTEFYIVTDNNTQADTVYWLAIGM